MKIKIATENDYEIIAYCPFHADQNRPNLQITKKGKYAGRYICWACGEKGYAKDLNIVRDYEYIPHTKLPVNWHILSKAYENNITFAQIQKLAQDLDVFPHSLKALRIGYNGQSYTYPMADTNGQEIGIQRRYEDGSKVFIKGSTEGLFIPISYKQDKLTYITEGMSDTAAALDLHLNVIGRVSSHSMIERGFTHNAVIIADNDESGIRGAKRLAKRINARMVVMPFKDLRLTKTILGVKKCLTLITNCQATRLISS